MVEDETGHLTWDIYGVPLSDVVFETEKTPRGAVRCVAFGNLIAITGIKSISPTPSCTYDTRALQAYLGGQPARIGSQTKRAL